MKHILTEEVETFFGHLHRGGTYAYYWTLDEVETYIDRNGDKQPVKLTHWFEVGRLPDLPQGDSIHIYFGVNPTNATKSQWQRVTNADVRVINCLFAEFDAKNYGGKEAALSHILSLEPTPSVIIDSGGGYHCYWLLRQPCWVSDKNRSEVAGVQRRWVGLMGGDGDAKDLSRVLRVPGTRNIKPKYAPNYPMVGFVKFDMDCLYDMDELAGYVPEPPKPEPRQYNSAWAGRVSDRRVQAYTEAAVRGIVSRLSSSGTGTRHKNSVDAGLAMGNLVGAGWISEGEAVEELSRAVSGFNDPVSALKAAQWGLDKGRDNPKQIEDRPVSTGRYNPNTIVRRGVPQDANTVVRSRTAQAAGATR